LIRYTAYQTLKLTMRNRDWDTDRMQIGTCELMWLILVRLTVMLTYSALAVCNLPIFLTLVWYHHDAHDDSAFNDDSSSSNWLSAFVNATLSTLNAVSGNAFVKYLVALYCILAMIQSVLFVCTVAREDGLCMSAARRLHRCFGNGSEEEDDDDSASSKCCRVCPCCEASTTRSTRSDSDDALSSMAASRGATAPARIPEAAPLYSMGCLRKSFVVDSLRRMVALLLLLFYVQTQMLTALSNNTGSDRWFFQLSGSDWYSVTFFKLLFMDSLTFDISWATFGWLHHNAAFEEIRSLGVQLFPYTFSTLLARPSATAINDDPAVPVVAPSRRNRVAAAAASDEKKGLLSKSRNYQTA